MSMTESNWQFLALAAIYRFIEHVDDMRFQRLFYITEKRKKKERKEEQKNKN